MVSNGPELTNERLKVITIIIIIIITVSSHEVNNIVIISKSKALLHFVVVSLIMTFCISL